MEDIDKIEQYLTGKMDGVEQQAFEAELNSNSTLAEELDAHRLAREAIELSIGDSLRGQFQEWHDSTATGTTKEGAKIVKMAPRIALRRVLAVAASVLLLLAVGSYWYANDRYNDPDLAMAFYEDSAIGKLRTGTAANHPLALGLDNMLAEDFAAADDYFNGIAPTDTNYEDARYYLGHSLYLQSRSEEAIQVLQSIQDSSNSNLRQSAEWLLLLSRLQEGQSESSKFQELLDKMLADSRHSYHPKAVELDKQLTSIWHQLAN